MLAGLEMKWPGMAGEMGRDNSCSEAALGRRVDQLCRIVSKATAAARFAFMRLGGNFPRTSGVRTSNPCVIVSKPIFFFLFPATFLL